MFLLEYTCTGVKWRPEMVDVQPADDLLIADVEAFERVTNQALRLGYSTVEEPLAIVRGRTRGRSLT